MKMKKFIVRVLTFVIEVSAMTGIGCLLSLDLVDSLWIALSCATIWTVEPIIKGIMKSSDDTGSRKKIQKIVGIFVAILVIATALCRLSGIILNDANLLKWSTDLTLGLICASFSIIFPIAEVYFKKR